VRWRGALVAIAVLATACATRHPAVAPLEGEAARLVADAPVADVVLLYGSELLGSIDGCGCLGNTRLGGLPYRESFAAGLRAAAPEVPLVRVDAGRSMGPFTSAEGEELADLVAQNFGLLDALGALEFDAINMTSHDAPFLSRFFDAATRGDLQPTHPVRSRIVSANLVPMRAGLEAPPPYVVRRVATPKGERRIAIAGATEPADASDRESGYRVADATASLDAALRRARAESDLVVVLAYMPARAADALRARLGTLADVVVAANSFGEPGEARLEAAPRLVYSWYRTEKLGELRLVLDGPSVAAAGNRYVEMQEPLPRDPRAEALVERTKAEVRRLREERFASSP
jgi:2',3'-cyclic-nucleotide 2'-phosphodiesterase (5'-nucleotidase family)